MNLSIADFTHEPQWAMLFDVAQRATGDQPFAADAFAAGEKP
jgi:hypothetical protein